MCIPWGINARRAEQMISAMARNRQALLGEGRRARARPERILWERPLPLETRRVGPSGSTPCGWMDRWTLQQEPGWCHKGNEMASELEKVEKATAMVLQMYWKCLPRVYALEAWSWVWWRWRCGASVMSQQRKPLLADISLSGWQLESHLLCFLTRLLLMHLGNQW